MKEELAESVLEVKWVSDTLMALKLEIKELILSIVSAYAPQVNNSMQEKNDFWEDMDGLIESLSKQERIVLGAHFNGHLGEINIEDEKKWGNTVLEQKIRKDRWFWIFGEKHEFDDCQHLFQEER